MSVVVVVHCAWWKHPIFMVPLETIELFGRTFWYAVAEHNTAQL